MQDNIVSDLEKYQSDISGLRDVLDHAGRDTCGSIGPQRPVGWRSVERSLFITIVQGAANRAGSSSPLVCTGLVSCAFYAQLVRSSLADSEAYTSGPGGGGVLGAASRMAFCHGIYYRYLYYEFS